MEDRRDFSVDDGDDDLGAQEPSAPETNELAAELEHARAEAADWQDKFLRKLAEFDNYRKRTRQETAQLRQIVAESIVADLLPIMDDFDRMLASTADPDDPYRRGAELVRGKLRTFLEAQGVQPMEAVGKPFDPAEHDALLMRPMPDFPPGTVLEVVTPGYRLGDRVIRHAQVVVSTEPDNTD